jgi:hypothetical protein
MTSQQLTSLSSFSSPLIDTAMSCPKSKHWLRKPAESPTKHTQSLVRSLGSKRRLYSQHTGLTYPQPRPLSTYIRSLPLKQTCHLTHLIYYLRGTRQRRSRLAVARHVFVRRLALCLGLRGSLRKRLRKVGDDVVDVLCADGDADQVLGGSWSVD